LKRVLHVKNLIILGQTIILVFVLLFQVTKLKPAAAPVATPAPAAAAAPAAAEAMESEPSPAAEKSESKLEESKPEAASAETAPAETKASTETAAAPAASVLASQPVVGEEFEKLVREIMDMMGHGRDEVRIHDASSEAMN
jgi:hypothetical protein